MEYSRGLNFGNFAWGINIFELRHCWDDKGVFGKFKSEAKHLGFSVLLSRDYFQFSIYIFFEGLLPNFGFWVEFIVLVYAID